MHHADENFEKCLEVLEESQRIVKTHYGTQSSEVSWWQSKWQDWGLHFIANFRDQKLGLN